METEKKCEHDSQNNQPKQALQVTCQLIGPDSGFELIETYGDGPNEYEVFRCRRCGHEITTLAGADIAECPNCMAVDSARDADPCYQCEDGNCGTCPVYIRHCENEDHSGVDRREHQRSDY